MQNVDTETLIKLRDLNEAKTTLALKAMDLEIERLQSVAVARRVSAELDALFDEIGTSRGIPSGTLFQVDMQTGNIVLDDAADAEPTPS